MIRDETLLHTFARLAEALSEEIVNASDADVEDVFPGYGGRVLADRLRQGIRRIGMSTEERAEEAAAPIVSCDAGRKREETAP